MPIDRPYTRTVTWCTCAAPEPEETLRFTLLDAVQHIDHEVLLLWDRSENLTYRYFPHEERWQVGV